jgi:hypothetical protein
MKNKKAEITSEEIVHWIPFFLSVIILLYFITSFDFSKTIDEHFCHLTVLAQDILPDLFKEGVPVLCTTSKICISRDGSCEMFKGRKVKKISSITALYDYLGEQMADCWWMFGEGKVNYVKQGLTSSTLYCSICSDLVFDNSIYSLVPGANPPTINKIDFYKYLESKKISKKQTYSQYLFLKPVSEIEAMVQEKIQIDGGDVGFDKNMYLPKIDLSKKYYVMMGEFNQVSIPLSVGAGVLAGAALTTVAIIFTGGAAVPLVIASYIPGVIAGGIVGGLSGAKEKGVLTMLGTIKEGDSGQKYVPPTIIEANSEHINSLKCKSITTTS